MAVTVADLSLQSAQGVERNKASAKCQKHSQQPTYSELTPSSARCLQSCPPQSSSIRPTGPVLLRLRPDRSCAASSELRRPNTIPDPAQASVRCVLV